MPKEYPADIKVNYFLNDANDGKIDLAKKEDRFTIFLDKRNTSKREEQLNKVLKIVFKQQVPEKGACKRSDKIVYTGNEVEVKEVSENVYKIVYKMPNSILAIDDAMYELRQSGIIAHHAYKPAGYE